MFSIDTRPEKIVAAAGPGKAKRKRALKARERRLAGLVFGDDDLTGRLVGAAEDAMVDSADAEEEIASEVSEGAEEEGGDSGDDDDVDHDDASEDDATEGESADEGADKAGVQSRSAAAAAWVDDDDAVGEVDVAHGRARLKKLRRAVDEERLTAEEYQQRLRAQFLSMQPRPAWAARKQPAARDRGGGSADDQDASEDEGVDAADEAAAQRVLRSGEPLLRADRGSLPPAELSVKRLVNLNAAEESRAVVRAVEWHPNGQLALTAGYDGTLRLFRVDGTANAKVQSVHVPKMQISSAAFTADGSQVPPLPRLARASSVSECRRAGAALRPLARLVRLRLARGAHPPRARRRRPLRGRIQRDCRLSRRHDAHTDHRVGRATAGLRPDEAARAHRAGRAQR